MISRNRVIRSMSDKTNFAFNEVDSFGDVAAEDDAVLNYFVSTNAVNKIENSEAFLVLGRKGTGKTAIVRYFTERADNTVSKSLNLRGYPWGVHASKVDHGASDIEAYVASWRYLIAVELSALLVSHKNIYRSSHEKPLKTFLIDNYGGPSPKLSDILRPKRISLSSFSFNPSVLGNQIGGVDMERSGKDHQFGLELNAVTSAIMDSVHAATLDVGAASLSLHFDELDQGLSRLDEGRSKMLIGLILAAREIRRESKKYGCNINPVIYLRSDIWEDLQFSDKNKISQTSSYNLVWTSANLLQLVENRIRVKTGKDIRWTDIIDDQLMRGSQEKWAHILRRTFLRPRDVIKFLNAILAEVKRRDASTGKLINQDIVGSREEYSYYLKAELDDEIRPHWDYWDEALQACSAISTEVFERDDFEREYNRRKSTRNQLDFREALGYLYRFSVIGYERRSGYGGTSWAFQYTDAEAGWDNAATRFKVHPGLKEYAKLRETRQ